MDRADGDDDEKVLVVILSTVKAAVVVVVAAAARRPHRAREEEERGEKRTIIVFSFRSLVSRFRLKGRGEGRARRGLTFFFNFPTSDPPAGSRDPPLLLTRSYSREPPTTPSGS